MAPVFDELPLEAIEALEERIWNEAQERKRCLKNELKAEFQEALSAEKERRFSAERQARELTLELQKLQGARSSSSGHEEDYEADDRRAPLLREEILLMSAPKEEAGLDKVSAAVTLLEGSTYKSLEHMSLAQLEGLDFDFKDLPCDMWGVAIMVLTKDLAELLESVEGWNKKYVRAAHLLYVLGCYLLNLILQLAVLHWVNSFVVGESVWTIQGNYAQFHADIFDKHGHFNQTAWNDWEGPREEVCGAVLTKGLFLGAMLFLWVGRMLGELKTCIRLHGDIFALPNAPSGASVAQTIVERNDQHEILALNCGMRYLLFVTVIVPKMFICIVLASMGLKWLTATESFQDLILNALALQFVINIDEQILQFFLPQRAAKNVQATKLAYPGVGPKNPSEKMAAVLKDYRRNILYFIAAFAITYGYLRYAQPVLPYYGAVGDLHEYCDAWFENRFTPKCGYFEKGCFKYGNGDSVHHLHDYTDMTPGEFLENHGHPFT